MIRRGSVCAGGLIPRTITSFGGGWLDFTAVLGYTTDLFFPLGSVPAG